MGGVSNELSGGFQKGLGKQFLRGFQGVSQGNTGIERG